MYIRRTKTKTLDQGNAYYTYRLVESVRLGQQVKQRTLLNLGKDFSIDQAHWPLLTARIEQLLQGSMPVQAELFSLSDALDQTLEAVAQRYSALVLQKHSQPVAPSEPSDGDKSVLQLAIEHDYQTVDINRLETLQARSIGTETLAYHAFKQLQLDKKLIALGFSRVDLAAAMGTIIGRMVLPSSELQTHD